MKQKFTPTEVKTFKKGDVVFEEGDKTKELYIISSGEVEVVKHILDEEVILARLDAGEFFGEMAIFGDEPRSATVRAISDLETIIISEEYFIGQLGNLPNWFGNMVEMLIERIREMDKKIISQFKYGLGYSILQLLYYISELYGTHTENQLAVNRKFLIEKIYQILGVSKGIIEKHFQDFISTKIIEIESETDKVIIKDKKLLEQFIEFFLCYSESRNLEKVQKQLPHFSEKELKNFYNLSKKIRLLQPDTLTMISM